MLYNNKQQQSLIELQISNICSKSGLALQIASHIQHWSLCSNDHYLQHVYTKTTNLTYSPKLPLQVPLHDLIYKPNIDTHLNRTNTTTQTTIQITIIFKCFNSQFGWQLQLWPFLKSGFVPKYSFASYNINRSSRLLIFLRRVGINSLHLSQESSIHSKNLQPPTSCNVYSTTNSKLIKPKQTAEYEHWGKRV